jgi:L-threonylcarbamoyladenylate synthase
VKRLVVDPFEPDAAIVREAADVLRGGGLVAYPTDTLYGLAVDPHNDAAVEKLFRVKERRAGVAVALIAATTVQAGCAGTFGDAEGRLASAFWPGPVTIVVPAAPSLSRGLLAADGTIGIRVPDHAVARALAGAFGSPITATSANMSGKPAPVSPDEVASTIGDRIGASPGGPPSTIVSCAGAHPVLLRPGAVAWERVLESLG